MKTFKLFVSSSAKSQTAKWQLMQHLARASFVPCSDGEGADFCIAVGGDGTFLRMVRECKFDSEALYVGVNTGTLGFLQEIRETEIESFVIALRDGLYIEQSISYLECVGSDTEALNEFVIRDSYHRIVKLEIRVDGVLLERFAGDGLLVCTSAGSTAYNLALGGAYVPFEMDTMQITPIAPLNSSAYRSLINSVVTLGTSTIEIYPEHGKKLLLIADGEAQAMRFFDKIKIALSRNRIRYAKVGRRTFWEKINDKFGG